MASSNATATSQSSPVNSATVSSPTASPTVVTTSSLIVTTSDSSFVVTNTPVTSTSFVSQSPTSTFIVGSTSTAPSVVSTFSSTVTVNPATTGGTLPPSIVTIISTQDPTTVTPTASTPSSSSSSSSASPSILGTADGSRSNNGSGLSTSGKIAIAVVIPIVVIALMFLLGLFLWRKRKARKTAEEQRKNEMAEYGFNPNNDPSLVPVVGAYTDGGSEAADDGYRGWGTTSSSNPRKPSTTMGSNSRAANGMAYSDTTSQPGGYGYQTSQNGQMSDHWSGDPFTGGHPEGVDGVGALGGAAAVGGAAGAAAMAGRNRNSQAGVQRGPSNASSSYSHNPPHSESSNELNGNIPSYYQEETPYNIYNDVAPAQGPYGDGSYANGAEQPVIRDVQARRNTRIERVPTFPQTQGGIAQNF